MEDALKFYQIPNDCCSCRTGNLDIVKIGKNFKEYFIKLKSGTRAADALDEMKIMRTCCRIKLLNLSTEIMIDRSKNRFVDNTVFPNIIVNTRELLALDPPPDFPAL